MLKLIGGLAMFLFGMSIMGTALERRAGTKLSRILERLTDKKLAGLLTGIGVTAIIQSSSATTVMVVGFVNSGLMTLRQSINVIMGANIGTTVTAWILSLAGISSKNVFIQLLKPTSFTPVLALIGVILYMFLKDDRKKETGLILLGFATLMFGMDTMSASVAGLKDDPAFRQLFLLFTNPILGVLAGALLTAIIQSSSASVGILQALASTGQVTYGAAVPIIMGQNIGTCVTALISSIGTNKNARRAALVHLYFNIIGTVVFLSGFYVVKYTVAPAILGESASMMGIAVAHSIFNIFCTVLLLPMSGLLEKIVMKNIPESKDEDKTTELDERLFSVPALALDQSRNVMMKMVKCSCDAIDNGIKSIGKYSKDLAAGVRKDEKKTDHYEDIVGTYLVALSSKQLSESESEEAAGYLKVLNDFESVADRGVDLIECAEEIKDKGLVFSDQAESELNTMFAAAREIVSLSCTAFENQDYNAALKAEALDRIISDLKEQIRMRHVIRLQQGTCSIGAGFVLSDILTSIESIGNHCSSIGCTVLDIIEHNVHNPVSDNHRESDVYKQFFNEYAVKYALARIDISYEMKPLEQPT